MNEYWTAEEQELDLIDALWRILEQWRGLVAAGLVLAILLTGAKYGLDLISYRSSLLQDGKAITERLDDNYETPVLKTMMAFGQWRNKKNYYDNSFLMKIDPSNEKRLLIRYYVAPGKTENADINTIASYYTKIQADNRLVNKIIEATGTEADSRYVREIISITSSSTEVQTSLSGGTLLSVSVILPRQFENDREKIEQAVTDCLTDVRKQIRGELGDFDIRLISSTVVQLDNQARLNDQTAAYSDMTTTENTFKNLYNALSEDEREQVDELILSSEDSASPQEIRNLAAGIPDQEMTDAAEDLQSDVTDAETSELPAPRPSAKLALLGLIAGMILYAAVYVCWLAFRRRIRTHGELGKMTGIRSYGGIYEYPYRTAPGRFLHSHSIYLLRHRKAKKAGVDAKKIAQALAVRAGHLNLDEITMIILGETTQWNERITQYQQKLLEEGGVKAFRVLAPQGALSMEEADFSSVNAAFLILLSGETSAETACDLLFRLKEYRIPVLGTEFLEGPAGS